MNHRRDYIFRSFLISFISDKYFFGFGICRVFSVYVQVIKYRVICVNIAIDTADLIKGMRSLYLENWNRLAIFSGGSYSKQAIEKNRTKLMLISFSATGN